MRKHLRCQRATSRAFGDKRLYREVSKPEQLEIPVGLPRERAFVWQHRGPTNNSLSPIAANAPLRVTSRSDANFQKWKSKFRGSEGSEGSMRCLDCRSTSKNRAFAQTLSSQHLIAMSRLSMLCPCVCWNAWSREASSLGMGWDTLKGVAVRSVMLRSII